MRGLRRHPSRTQLEMWFDGEASDGLAWHVATCTSCFRHVDRLGRIRRAVQGDLAPAGTAAPATPALGGAGLGHVADDRELVGAGARRGVLSSARSALQHRGRALIAVPTAAVLLGAGVAVGITAGHHHGPAPSAPGQLALGTGAGAPSTTASGGAAGAAGAAAAGAPGTSSGAAHSSSGTSPTGVGGGVVRFAALRLGLVVPTQGALAAEGAEVTTAVRDAVNEVNAAGGVGGQPVQLTVVAAEDSAAVAALAGQVDDLVGGFGTSQPVGVPWVLPADPWAAGSSIVSTELSPKSAGVRLARDLIHRGDSGTVGVIEGSGPDAAMAAGIAQVLPTTVAQQSSETAPCLPALVQLHQQGVDAVAIAGSPSLAANCLSAAASLAWAPPGGVLVAPSAAYANAAGGTGVFTVLGLPWPASASPGAARFRSVAPGVTSYRALVSFAAVEMAVDVARSAGSATIADIAGGTWHNDLFDFDGTANAGAQVVEASTGGWVSAP